MYHKAVDLGQERFIVVGVVNNSLEQAEKSHDPASDSDRSRPLFASQEPV